MIKKGVGLINLLDQSQLSAVYHGLSRGLVCSSIAPRETVAGGTGRTCFDSRKRVLLLLNMDLFEGKIR